MEGEEPRAGTTGATEAQARTAGAAGTSDTSEAHVAPAQQGEVGTPVAERKTAWGKRLPDIVAQITEARPPKRGGGRVPSIVQEIIQEIFDKQDPPNGGWTFTKDAARQYLLQQLAAAGPSAGASSSAEPRSRSTRRGGTFTDAEDILHWQGEEIQAWAATDLPKGTPEDVRGCLAAISSGFELSSLKQSDLAARLGLAALSRNEVRKLMVECGATCSKDDEDEDGVSTIEENCDLEAPVLLELFEDGFVEGATDEERAESLEDNDVSEEVGQAIYNRCIAIQAEAEARAAATFPVYVEAALHTLHRRYDAYKRNKRAVEVQRLKIERRRRRALRGGRPGYFVKLDDGGAGAADESKNEEQLPDAAAAAAAAAASSVNLVGEVMAHAAVSGGEVEEDKSSAGGGVLADVDSATGQSLVPRFMRGLAMDDAEQAKHELLTKVSNTFIERARAIGMVIIADHFKPVEQRIFKPRDIGGIAGGTKYIEDGILFKFANPDGEGSPYGESFELANKAAGLDLSGAIAIMHGARAVLGPDEQLHVSLQALVDHLGFRVQVMTLLPLGKGSLKVGSDDACVSLPHGGFDDTEKELNRRMAKVAAAMGLAGHEIKVGADSIELHFGADVECHLDEEGNARVLDTARVFPPENPLDQGIVVPSVPGHTSIYWRLLRPELVKSFVSRHPDKPLSSDGFSQFAGEGKDSKEQNERLRQATRFLMDEQVPLAAGALARERGDWWADGGKTVTRILHRHGVNMRHAGAVWKLLGEWCRSSRCNAGSNEPQLDKEEEEEQQGQQQKETKAGEKPSSGESRYDLAVGDESKDDRESSFPATEQDMSVADYGTHGADGDSAGAGTAGAASSPDQKPRHHSAPQADPTAIAAAQRAVAQEMAVRVVKNLVRSDLRLGLSVGAGPVELRRITARSFSCITNGDTQSDGYWVKVTQGLTSRFGVAIPDLRQTVDAIALIKAVAARVGTRLTHACLNDLVAVQASVGHGGSRPTAAAIRFAFSRADVEAQEPRIKFLDVDDRAQGALLRHVAASLDPKDVETKRRLLAQCDNKLSAAQATFAGDVAAQASISPTEVTTTTSQNKTIAFIKVEQVECICLGRTARKASLRVRNEELWPSVECVGAFGSVAGLWLEDGSDTLALDLAERLYRVLMRAKLANRAWSLGVLMYLEPAARQLDARERTGASRRLALMERMLALDGLYYPLRSAACHAFSAQYGGMQNDDDGRSASKPPSDTSEAMLGLIAEAQWRAYRIGDKVEARRGVDVEDGWGTATIKKCNGGGQYLLEFDDSSFSPRAEISDYRYWEIRDITSFNGCKPLDTFRGRSASQVTEHEGRVAAADVHRKQELLAWVWEFGRPPDAIHSGCEDGLLLRNRSSDWGERLASTVTMRVDEADREVCNIEAVCEKRRVSAAFRNATKLDVVDDEKGQTILMRVVDRKDTALVSHLVTCDVDLDVRDHSGKSAIWLASSQGDAEIVGLLLDAGVDINRADYDGAVPLCVAASKGFAAVTERLIGAAGAQLDVVDPNGATPLFIAAEAGHAEVVGHLIRGGATLDLAENEGKTPLYIASRNGHSEASGLLIGAGANVDLAESTGASPLFIASDKGHDEIVRQLIGAGAKLDCFDNEEDGWTPLLVSSSRGHESVVGQLISAGAKVNLGSPDIDSRPLTMAAQNGHSGIVTLLLEAGAHVNTACTDDGQSPLFVAAEAGHTDVVDLLLGAGANVNVVTTEGGGQTPLHIAADQGRAEVVELLIRAGAEVNTCLTTNNFTPLMSAAVGGHQLVAAALVAAGADREVKSTLELDEHPAGSTAKNIAEQLGHEQTTAVLEAL